MKILGAIIAGGKSSRMGQEKALMEFRGRPLIAEVAARLGAQVDALVINANGDATRFQTLGLDVVPDRYETHSPLAGLHAALSCGAEQGFDAVLTVPCDGPFLPLDLAARLKPVLPAIAASQGQAHYLTGLWPSDLAALLDLELKSGLVRVMDWAALAKAREVEWTAASGDPFANLNTPEDFRAASAPK
ncbi:molybdenum cofactor guanylyltransferase [Aestuariivirga litoralis]|uniref:molybdenum cofactor guanylyltransferase n=1 Tax=Aestuariivirga litoralis TaxID=2650924 RepID=UPI0018C67A25|nr:molybdenum cofactor guanylyltransferase [Aestuariivirga litoralis]MBG1233716.1 molybdenum cofactor guanylyltransferase [Aestuariivirga litoralis]